MTITPERRAQIQARIKEVAASFQRQRLPKPKVIVRDGIGTVRDADVRVSRADVNANGAAETIAVYRPPGWCTINMQAAEMQMAERARDRAYRKSLDPARLGHWGNPYD